MDNLVIGLIVVLALAYIGNKFTNKCLVKVAAAVVAVAPSLALKNLLVAVVAAAVMVPIKH